ncbi:hypothetical protein BDW62DRAFT_200157 [Aspergillus aurantiobrunneus]
MCEATKSIDEVIMPEIPGSKVTMPDGHVSEVTTSAVTQTPLQLDLEQDDDDDPHEALGKYTRWKAYQVLKGYLEDDGCLSLNDAALQLYKMMPDRKPKPSDELQDLCIELAHVAKQILYSHPGPDKLVNLVRRLDLSDSFIPVRETEKDDREFININAFQARLASAGLVSVRAHAVCYLRNTLEGREGYGVNSLSVSTAVSSVGSVWSIPPLY